VAGNARRELEAKTGAPVLSKKNYLGLRGTALAAVAPAQTIKVKGSDKGKKT
jgi:hypothetical protein